MKSYLIHSLSHGFDVDYIQQDLYQKTGFLHSRRDLLSKIKKICFEESKLIEFRDKLISEGTSFFDSVFLGLSRIEVLRRTDPEITADIPGFVDRLIYGLDLESLHQILDILHQHKYDLYSEYPFEEIDLMISKAESYLDWLVSVDAKTHELFVDYLHEDIDLAQLEQSLNSYFEELEKVWFVSLGSVFNIG